MYPAGGSTFARSHGQDILHSHDSRVGQRRMEFPNTTDALTDLIGAEFPGRTEGASYRLDRIIGEGTAGVVFRATRRTGASEDLVVVKVFRPSFVRTRPEVAQLALQKESVALARLNERTPPTPFVVRLLDGADITVITGFDRTVLPWLALEYVQGGALGTTLRERVRESIRRTGAAFGPTRARRLIQCVARGMEAIHEVGVVHRDLKPSNVLLCGVDDDELAKVSDFGLARSHGMIAATFGGFRVGTPGYTAPEQIDGENVGPWSDVFSMAALVYFVLSGEDLFKGNLAAQVMALRRGDYTSLETRAALDPALRQGRCIAQLDHVLRGGMRPDVAERYRNIHELWSALDPILAEAEPRAVTTMAASSDAHVQAAPQPWSFTLVRWTEPSLELRDVCFDPDGHALAVGRTGLLFWEGARWMPMASPRGVDVSGIRRLWRLGPSRWLACGDRGLLCVFTPLSCEWAQVVGDGRLDLTALCVTSERHFALAAKPTDGSSPPLLLACIDGEWRPMVSIDDAVAVHDVSTSGLGRWLAVGENAEGRGVLLRYSALFDSIDRFDVDSAPLHAVLGADGGRFYAVGCGGYAYRRSGSRLELERVMTTRDLGVLGMGPARDVWAAAPGRLLRRAEGKVAKWEVRWTDPEFRVPFLKLLAESGLLMVAARDGSVLIGHQDIGG